MTKGVGGKTAEEALATLSDMTEGSIPIALPEFEARIAKAQALMAAFISNGHSALFWTRI